MALSSGQAGGRRVLSRSWRTAGWFFLMAAGCILAAWFLRNAWSGRAADRPASAPGLVREPSPELDPPPAPGMVNVRMRVRSFDAAGNEHVVGKELRERVTLKLAGLDGQPYEAQFDRVGMWAMEIPPGEYLIAREQPSLKSWRWTLSGRGVTNEGKKGYRVIFQFGQAPTLQLVLR